MEANPTSLQQLSKSSGAVKNLRKTQNLETTISRTSEESPRPFVFEHIHYVLGSGGEICTVFDEESESEVENLEILHPDFEMRGKLMQSKIFLQWKMFVFLIYSRRN